MKSFDGCLKSILDKFVKIKKDIIDFTLIFDKENPCKSSKVIHKMNKIFVANIGKNRERTLNIRM